MSDIVVKKSTPSTLYPTILLNESLFLVSCFFRGSITENHIHDDLRVSLP